MRQPNLIQKFANARALLRSRPFQERRHQAYIPLHREVREKTRLLNHIPRFASQVDQVPFGNGTPSDKNLAARWHEQSVDQPERRGFPGAAASQQDESLSSRNLKGQMIQNRPA